MRQLFQRGKHLILVSAAAGSLAAAALAGAPAVSHAATVVVGGSPFNAGSCAALGATINGLEAQTASNPKAATGLQQTADALKTVAMAQGCFVSPA